MKKFKIIISYDGSNFHGWQIQPEVRTAAGEIIAAIKKILRHEVDIRAASRTDAGVHALGQTADFSTEKDFSPLNLLKALNAVLPHDIVVKSVEEVDENFHSTYDAKGKHYQYKIYNAEFDDPLSKNFHWHYKFNLNIDLMKNAAKYLVGKIDFKGLEVNSGKNDVETIREISNINIDKNGNMIFIDIFGKSFMYKLVRSLVGLLVAAGSNKIKPEDIPEIIARKDEHRKTDVAPAKGLTLIKVFY